MPGAFLQIATAGTVLFLASLLAGGRAPAIEVSGRVGLESRWYYRDGAHPGQRSHASGVVVEPRLYAEDEEGRSVTLAPFFRYDAGDSHRAHFDVREAYFLLFGEVGDGEWELRLGADRVFWGVAESRHLVDIVNQTDLIENPNEEAKLGQLMAHLTWSAEWGVAEVFALPYHRERTYPGRDGRLRDELVVDDKRVSYESSKLRRVAPELQLLTSDGHLLRPGQLPRKLEGDVLLDAVEVGQGHVEHVAEPVHQALDQFFGR